MSVVQIFREFAEAINQVHVSPMLRPFAVTITIGRQVHELHVLAFKSCDAISSAIDIYFDGEYEMPDEMSIKARPANVLRAA